MYTFMKCLSWIICHLPDAAAAAWAFFLGFFLDFCPEKTKSIGSGTNFEMRHY